MGRVTLSHAPHTARLALLALLPRAACAEEPSVEPAPEAPRVSAAPPTVEEAGQAVPQAWPLEMRIPAVGIHATFQLEACAVKSDAMAPNTMTEACVYVSHEKRYELPGSDAPDIVVVAGHTGAGVRAVFDRLYDGAADTHTITIGDALYVRTADSGERWLRYRATDLHDPEKGALPTDASVWGVDPTPGRLLTINCIQLANLLAQSVRNAVVGWQYDGVAETAGCRGGLCAKCGEKHI